MVGARVSSRLLELLKIFFLARLLTPEQFGIFGLGMFVVLMLDYLSQTGMHSALVKKEDITQTDFDTVWVIQIIRGFILGFIIFLAAPAFAKFFHEPGLELFLRVLSLVPVLQGFTNTGVVLFEKQFQFNKVFFYEVGSTFSGVLVAIFVGFLYRSAWALLWGNIALVIFRLVYSYIVSTVGVQLTFDRVRAIELFRFGKWLSGQSGLLFLTQQVDKLVIGRVAGAHVLGIYQISQRLAEIAVANIASVATKVTFPAYVELRNSKTDVDVLCLDILEVLLSIILPLNIFLMVLAPELVDLLLGPGWVDAVLVIQLLAASAMFLTLDHSSAPVFLAYGYPRYEFFKQLSKAMVLAIVIYPLTKSFGAKGAGLAVLIASVTIFPFWLKGVALASVKPRDLLQILIRVVTHCGVTLGVLTLVSSSRLTSSFWVVTFATVMCLLSWLTVSLVHRCLGNTGVLCHLKSEPGN